MTEPKASPYQSRLAAVRSLCADLKVEGILITNDTNRRWLSGFTGSSGKLVVTETKALLATDFRYWEQMTREAPDFTLFKHLRRPEDDSALFAEAGISVIALEGDSILLNDYAKLKELDDLSWKILDAPLNRLREIKNSSELQLIQEAAAITDQAMARVDALARPGITEAELAWELEKTMRSAGAEGTAFDIIVAGGPNSALPHHHPGNRPLQAGDPLIVDMGAQVAGYKSDLTRSFYLGSAPDARYMEIYETVLAANTAVITHIRPGMNGREVDALARDFIREAGYGDYFGHGLGHGVGLDIHETPRLSKLADDNNVMAADMVVTVEPGIYIPGWGGVRIEDLGRLTDKGFESLSHAPKQPHIPC